MKKIFKYQLNLADINKISAPFLRPLSVQMQDNKICLWAEVDTLGTCNCTMIITIVGTGTEMSRFIGEYLGTVQHCGYVWHVYWRYE